MNTHMPTGFSNAALLDALGLQVKASASTRILGSAALLAAGIVVGAAAGVLLAPRSGRQLRHDLRASAKEVGEQVGASANGAIDAVSRTANALKNHGERSPVI